MSVSNDSSGSGIFSILTLRLFEFVIFLTNKKTITKKIISQVQLNIFQNLFPFMNQLIEELD